MIYIVLVFLLILYFEILGQWILSKLNVKEEPFSFGVGFLSILALLYVLTSVLTALGVSFYIFFGICMVVLLLSVIFVIKDIRNVSFHFDVKSWLILFVFAFIVLSFSAQTSLGELNGYDSTHYLNMVTGNIGNPAMNSRSVVFGDVGTDLGYAYRFQTYFYFASVVLYLFEKVSSFVNIAFFASTGFYVSFQIFYVFFLGSVLITGLNKIAKKKYVLSFFVLLVFAFIFGRIYYNSVFGFYGNTMRTVALAYASYYLYLWFETRHKSYKALFAISLLASCALSSSAVFMVFFSLFALFFVLVDSEDFLLKEYAIVLFVPAINLLTVLRGNLLLSLTLSSIMSLALWFLNDGLIHLIRRYKLKYPILIASIILMVVLSYRVTGNIFDFSAFFENGSERYDMTLNYFVYQWGTASFKMFKFLSIVLLGICMFLHFKNPMIQMFWILILVFFNPFCCSFLNSVNVVYYRAYDLILNPFTFIMLLEMAVSVISIKYIEQGVMIALTLLFVWKMEFKAPDYWHDSFIPGDDYNVIYKINNDDLNVIKEIKGLVDYYGIENPKIITPNLLTQSMIPNGIYIYGREYKLNPRWSESEKELYGIFWPVLHYGDARQPKDPDYEHMCEYIEDAKIDFIVQPKSTEYYDEGQNIWYALTYKIDECGTYAFYENDTYAVYHFMR